MISIGRIALLLSTVFASALLGQDQRQPKFPDIDNIGSRNINRGDMNFTSIEREITAGRQMAAELEQQVTLLDDPVVAEYVNRIGQNLVMNSDARNLPFTIKVVNSADVNASSLPGGFIYVNTGVIIAADNEAELASVIACQVAHVAARHSTELATKAELINVASVPAVLNISYQERAERLVPDSFVRFMREDVREADYLGIQYLYRAGYDPRAAADFLRKLPSGVGTLFSTHPSPAQRIEGIQKSIRAVLPRREKNMLTTPEFDAIRMRVVDRR
jgi:predicted Zn-dependent protease